MPRDLAESSEPFVPPREAWFLTGATASGKTAVAIELARLLNAEIISVDSMAVYRGMDVGTAKPTRAERAAVPHHLVDIVDPSQEYSVAQFIEAARAASAEVLARSRVPLFVGGTPLYLKALLRGLFRGPAADWALRARLLEIAERDGPESLHARLAEVDPASAARLHARDLRRVVRALEVFELTGQPLSAAQRQFAQARGAHECRVFVLDWPREELTGRIDRRVDRMFADGLVEEVRGLAASGVALGRTAREAVGYREVLAHLAGEADLAATIDAVKLRTRQCAKRQLTWFRSLSECRSVSVAEPFDPAAIAERIAVAGTTDAAPLA